MACTKDHSSIQHLMEDIPFDQGGAERHKCAACAYELGYQDGLNKKNLIDFNSIFDNIEYCQAGEQRHRSARAAYIKGYYNGLKSKLIK